jgi:hypothetical protein
MINGDMDLLHSAGEAYAAQRTASGVKVELNEGGQHGSINLPLTRQGAQRLKLIVGSPNSRARLAPVTFGTTQTPIPHIIKQEPVRGPTPVKISDAFPIHAVFALECAACSDFVTRDMKVCVKVVVASLGERGICGVPLVSDRGAMQERCQGVAG